MSSIKFRRDRPEMNCPHALLDNNYRDEGGLACLRIEGHEPPCISLACDAAEADGVCFDCRNPMDQAHEPDCNRPVVHLSDWAEQPDIRIACDQSYTQPAWKTPQNIERIRNLPHGVYLADDDRLYTFGHSTLPSCPKCWVMKKTGGGA